MKPLKNNKIMYFPSLKNSLKLGLIVSLTTVLASILITGINIGMTWIMSMI